MTPSVRDRDAQFLNILRSRLVQTLIDDGATTSAKFAERSIIQQFETANLWSKFYVETIGILPGWEPQHTAYGYC